MFKVKIGEDEYEVTFEHYIPDEIDRKMHSSQTFREKFGTVCWIDGKAKAYCGISDLSPKDNFNRKVGCKLSLARALQQAFPRDQIENRLVFWDAYYEARGKKW